MPGEAAAGMVSELEKEALFACALPQYPGIIRVFEFLTAPGPDQTQLGILSMEYADAGTFKDWLAQHRDDAGRAVAGLEWFRDICAAVTVVHEAGIVHLDLKPSNFLFVGDTIKLSDFGLAVGEDIVPETHRLPDPGEPGHWGSGTPPYMSPEQFRAISPAELDLRSDIYSLGTVMFEVLSPACRPPFRGSHRHVRRQHHAAPVPELPGIGRTESKILARCLAKRPVDRYRSVEELLDDLSCCGNAQEIGGTEEPSARSPELLWEDIDGALARGDLAEAARGCRAILAQDPGHADSMALLEQINIRYDQAERLYETVVRELNTGDLHALVNLVVQAAEAYPEHPAGAEVQSRLELRLAAFSDAMAAAERAVENGDFEQVLLWAQEALDKNPGSPRTRGLVARLTAAKQHALGSPRVVYEPPSFRNWLRRLFRG